jgi:hypothetical protein
MKEKEEITDYFKEYYKENKFRFKELHTVWIKKNKLKWNKYQAWHSRVRYWEKKLVSDTTNENFLSKLNKTYDERPD